MEYILECLEKFEKLPEEIKEAFGGEQTYKAIKELEDQFKLDLSFVVVLLAIDELSLKDVPEYLQLKFKLEPEKANIITKEIEDNVVKVADDYASGRQEEEMGENINIQEIIMSVFSENFLSTLSFPSEDIKNFNIASFAAFNEDDRLEDKVIDLFYNNQELISKKKIKIDDKEVKASIANFLKDFIKTHGSAMPDNLMLANYLNTSGNVKKLTQSEKNILNQILKTYRNLVFFPESMEGVPLEYWELVPIKGEEHAVFDVLAEEKEGLRDDFEKRVIDSSRKNVMNKKKHEEIEKRKEERVNKLKDLKRSSISQLRKMLPEYPVGSLGYKAIKQELDRLQKNKKN